MQEQPSGDLPRRILEEGVDQLGRRIAQVIKPGSSVDRSRRAEIRALLRESFKATQEVQSLDTLGEVYQRLHNVLVELGHAPGDELAKRLAERGRFGVVDPVMVARHSRSVAAALEQSDRMALAIETRIRRILEMLGDFEAVAEEESDSRPIRLADEEKELITKRVG